MSNPTTPFNWQMPTNTDLVTDLPADFEVFGQAVATSMADLLGGTTGQILSKASNTDMDFTWIANDQGDITGVTATSPLTGGGTSGAITVGIQDASTTQKGAVQLSDSTSTTSSILAATPTAVKAAYDKASTAATTSVAGIVQLSDSTSTTSSVLASTPTATKSAYDLANAAIPKSTATAKGNVFTATAASTPAVLAVGTNGQVLTADSTTATGLKWGTASTGSLTLITTQALSGVTSQSINNCFSSTYQNYVIVFSAYCATSANNPTFKLRVSGTDSSANYYSAFTSANWTSGGAATGYTNNGSSWDQRPLGSLDTSTTSLSGTTMTLYSPFAATNTAFTASYLDARVGANNGAGSTGGLHNSATSYDGFTITNATAMTGTVRVYGLAN